MKLFTIIGARPQFIKAAAFSLEVAKSSDFSEVILHTGQHYDPSMSSIFFEEMGIPSPKYSLNVNGLSHGAMTGRMIEAIEEKLLIEKPDLVVVYGDTNSTLAGAIAASKLHIPIIHIEAGLRSRNFKMPEEINRILSDQLSSFLFCSSEEGVRNLHCEGLASRSIGMVGDIMLDAVQLFASRNDESLKRSNESSYYLCTLHRAENTDDKNRLAHIVQALNRIHLDDLPVILPLHPRTEKKLTEFQLDLKVKTIPPVGYSAMLKLIKESKKIITDSGGLQKEAYFLQKDCVIMRDETEWVELLNYGNTLVGADSNRIFQEVIKPTSDCPRPPIYGDGTASSQILAHLRNNYESTIYR